jgi:hypothetical protein
VANTSTIVTVDLIDEITATAGPILAMTTGINVITAATTVVMTGTMTTIAMTATTGAMTTEMIVMMIAMMIITTIDETTNMMIDAPGRPQSPRQ